MVALVSDPAHRAPDNPLRVSGSQQDRALSQSSPPRQVLGFLSGAKHLDLRDGKV
jgi:hypothetical protein